MCRYGCLRVTPKEKCEVESGDKPIGLGARSTCSLLRSLTAARGSGHACLRRRKRLPGHVVVSEFDWTPQAFRHPASISGTDIQNLAASKIIHQVIADSGS